SQRKESDTVRILSGVFDGLTLGTPIALEIPNEDMRPGDYREMQEKYRPSHADYTYDAKYGIRDWRGRGPARARASAARGPRGGWRRRGSSCRPAGTSRWSRGSRRSAGSAPGATSSA